MSTIPQLPLVAWKHYHRSAEILRRTGHPGTLAAAATALEAFPEDQELTAAARAVRKLEREARLHLYVFELHRISFDFESGTARLPSGGRRGPRETLMPRMIAAAFEELARREWYSQETYNAVRDRLRLVLDESDVAPLTDAQIRRAIERHVNKRR